MRSTLFNKPVFSWLLYDWANSAFVTSVMVALLPIAFKGYFHDAQSVELGIGALSWTSSSDSLWAYANSFYMACLVLVAPVLGAIADSARGKKKFLAFCAFGGGGLTIALAAPGEGHWVWVSLIYAGAAFLWGAGNIFYDGFLPELTDDPGKMDDISTAGYGLGYLGGGLMLLLNVLLIFNYEALGLASEMAATRVCFATVGVWWIVFTLPLLRHVKEGPAAGPAARREGGYVRQGFKQLKVTLGKVRRLPEMAKFLVAFLLYNTGIGTIFVVAAKFADSSPETGGLGLGTGTIIAALLMIQFVGLPAAFGFIWLARRIGNRASIFAGIGVYIFVVIYALFVDSAAEFWVLAGLVALVQGGTQAMSRSMFGSFVPAGCSAEFFGFFSIFNKVGSGLGPLAFGIARDVTGSMRMGIFFLIVFFLGGLAMLAWVNRDRGRAQAAAFLNAEFGTRNAE